MKRRCIMKRTFKAFLSLFLILALLLPGSVFAAVQVIVPENMVVYLPGNGIAVREVILCIGPKTSKIKGAKSSKPSVAKVISCNGEFSEYYEHNVSDDTDTTRTSEGGVIELECRKPGSAAVSYKIGKKNYKTKVTVKKYTNPIASIKIDGVNKGKDFASRFKSGSSAESVKVTANKSIAKATIKAKKDWMISQIEYHSTFDALGDSITYSDIQGWSSKTAYIGPLKKGQTTYMTIYMYNKKNGGNLIMNVRFN